MSNNNQQETAAEKRERIKAEATAAREEHKRWQAEEYEAEKLRLANEKAARQLGLK